jgi:hypothetical protein
MKSRLSKRQRRLLIAAGVLSESLGMLAHGYPIGGRLVVRCRRGHLFTTLWVPGVSLKALRLGWTRVQWCPVGGHWSLVRPVRDAELSNKERRLARSWHDLPLP